ncbi:MAG: L-histidine N(alpha)-methyltransferase [Alphaproteobacteria bacterium]|nr:L-histidine N(alpha)-methyltransferase [Alphaproteobacteria bacterium]
MIEECKSKLEGNDFTGDFKSAVLMVEDVHLAMHLYETSKNNNVKGAEGWENVVDNFTCYYPPHEEKEILNSPAAMYGISHIIGAGATIIELGPGSTVLDKTALLIDALEDVQGYVGIDASEHYAQNSASAISKEYPNIYAEGIQGNFYDREIRQRIVDMDIEKPVLFSAGATIGNIAEDHDYQMPINTIIALEKLRKIAGDGGYFIVSQNTDRNEDSLKGAYFHDGFKEADLNILERARNEAGISLDPRKYDHRNIITRQNGKRSCVISQLIATDDQDIVFPDKSIVSVKKGNTIDVNRSYQFECGYFQEVARMAGWQPKAVFASKSERMVYHVLQAVRQNQH